MIKGLAKFLKSLNANQRPGEIALAVSFAWLLALVPTGNALWILLLALTFFIKMNTGVQTLFLLIFKTFVFLLDPIIHGMGKSILEWPALTDFYNGLWNTPFIIFFRLNNTLVMGGFVLGVLTFVPVLLLFRQLLLLYRNRWRESFVKSPLGKALAKLPLVKQLGMALKAVENPFKN